MTVLHDTELCADESGCDRKAVTRDLCMSHYRKQEYIGELAPKFFRCAKGSHTIREKRGTRWFCVGCSGYVICDVYFDRPQCRYGSVSRNRKVRTGWSEIDYDLALIAQGNKCYICGESPKQRHLHADHCHVSGKTRKLLCSDCNAGLGLFKDNRTTLQAAISYLEEVPQ